MIVGSDRFGASIWSRSWKASGRIDPTPSVIFQIGAEETSPLVCGWRKSIKSRGRTTKMATPLRHGTVVEQWLVRDRL